MLRFDQFPIKQFTFHHCPLIRGKTYKMNILNSHSKIKTKYSHSTATYYFFPSPSSKCQNML